jgi:hypothetical protein
MIPVVINTQFFNIPAVEHEQLLLVTDAGKERASAGMIKQVEVPVGGIEVHFLTGGGQPCSPAMRITTTWEMPKPLPAKPAPRVKTPNVPKQPIPEQSDGRVDVKQPEELQPLVESPQGDGPSVSGEVRVEVPSMGAGDPGLQG